MKDGFVNEIRFVYPLEVWKNSQENYIYRYTRVIIVFEILKTMAKIIDLG